MCKELRARRPDTQLHSLRVLEFRLQAVMPTGLRDSSRSEITFPDRPNLCHNRVVDTRTRRASPLLAPSPTDNPPRYSMANRPSALCIGASLDCGAHNSASPSNVAPIASRARRPERKPFFHGFAPLHSKRVKCDHETVPIPAAKF